ncbi:MAG: sulfatase-like hydrolase/transferase, partial [Saprospiraceae bacterium]|nr:sulfatase-like hydrolase/transferase [Saprospiraceae bacterium]
MSEAALEITDKRGMSAILPKHLVYILRVYLLGILCFTIFRAILLVQEFHQMHFIPTDQGIMLGIKAFLMGLRFDTVVMGYILTLPFLLLAIDALAGWNSKLLYRIVVGLVTVGVIVALFICAADLPFFHHFYTRVSTSILISADKGGNNDMLSGMILQEWRYVWPFIPFLLTSWLVFSRNQRLLRNILYKYEDSQTLAVFKWFAIFAALLGFGIWGRFSFQSHLAASTAYSSDYGFINMLGLNPAFTFTQSFVNSKTDAKNVRLMGDGEALRNMQQYLKIPAAQEFDSPIARQVTFADSLATKPNVVLVIMESMSASKMGRYGNKNNLTPFMDSLANVSLSFDSIYTSGIHTFAGVYSTLFSHHVVKRKHPLNKVVKMSGIATNLKEHGYSTIYFTTHDKGFDNVAEFLQANDYDRIVSKDDYPPERILSALGVP